MENQHASSVSYETFVIERVLNAPVEKVFAAFSNLEEKSKWFAGPAEWQTLQRDLDFKVCGAEHLKNKMPNGMTTTFSALYQDIVPNNRIVYTYDMHIDDKKISISLATMTFITEGLGTKLTLTEQGAFLDGYDKAENRKLGTEGLINQLAALFEK